MDRGVWQFTCCSSVGSVERQRADRLSQCVLASRVLSASQTCAECYAASFRRSYVDPRQCSLCPSKSKHWLRLGKAA